MDKEEEGQAISGETGDRTGRERGDSGSSGQDSTQGGPEELDIDTAKEEVNLADGMDAETFQKVVLVQLMRLYDLQLAFLTLADKDFASYIASLHDDGEFFGPNPALRF